MSRLALAAALVIVAAGATAAEFELITSSFDPHACVDFPDVDWQGGELTADQPLVVSIQVRNSPEDAADHDAIAGTTRVVVLPACENRWMATVLGDVRQGAWSEGILAELPVAPRRESHVDSGSWGEANVDLGPLVELGSGDYHVVALVDDRRVPGLSRPFGVGVGLHVRIEGDSMRALPRYSLGNYGAIFLSISGDCPLVTPPSFTASPSAWAVGRVESACGEPLMGVQVVACMPPDDPGTTACEQVVATSQADGTFELPLPPWPVRDVWVVANLDGFEPVDTLLESSLDLTMTRRCAVKLRVLAEDTGEPHANVDWELRELTPDGTRGILSGSGLLDGLEVAEAGSYTVTVTADGYEALFVEIPDLEAGEVRVVPDVLLRRHWPLLQASSEPVNLE